MTREDAIFFLNELRSANNCDETIDMAIAALSGWVKTADRVPGLDERALVWKAGHIAYWNITEPGCHVPDEFYTHWLPLPPLPETAGLEGTKINGGE